MKNWMVYVSGVFFFLVIGVLFIVLITRNKKPDTTQDKKPATQQQAPVNKIKQAKKNGSAVVYAVHGQVVGDEKYRGIRITVTPNQRTVELLQTYSDQVIKTQSTPNTPQAYDAFVTALDGAQFSQTKPLVDNQTEDTVCPLGQHFAYDIIGTDQATSQHSWSTSCSSKFGDFAGRGDIIRTLFRKQIPDYEKFTAKFAL